ncbi:MAG: phosphate/phosphite/phosphonate ABC transporter substrate-binding protein [Candidatus Cloacimonetes bacterium]|nr:phosphate/phosphite/phosphonate ABC transporter substrate-binding protein [Candidatus Cloacimonadota bacterium]
MQSSNGKKKARLIIVLLIIWIAAIWVVFLNRTEEATGDDVAIPAAPQGNSLGSERNPIKMYFVPSLEANKVLESGEEVAELVRQRTGYHFEVAVPTSYAAVIEAMGTGEADIAWLATFAYVLASDHYGAEVGLTTVRNGLRQYRGQFIAHESSDINGIEDIAGKTVAYTDAASTSGFIYPSAILKRLDIEPSAFFYSGGHPQSVLAVYQGTADVGCTYWSPVDDEGIPRDARFRLFESHPDVFEKVKIVGFTDWIPNDTVTFAKGFPLELRENIIAALLDITGEESGKNLMIDLYEIDGFVRSQDSDYDVVRQTLADLGVSADAFIE